MPYFPPDVVDTPQATKLTKYLPLFKRGKVRDIYDLGRYFLIVTTDRASAFDRVLGRLFRNKGYALNILSTHFMQQMAQVNIEHLNHLLAVGPYVDYYLDRHSELRDDPDLQTRSVVVLKSDPLLVEFVVRGYITGSGWQDYLANGSVCGVKLPSGLREGDKLDQPILTPATKAEEGHDINITEAQAAELVPEGMATIQRIKALVIEAYLAGSAMAEEVGIIIADTKFELSYNGCFLDEMLTPDSSRFWPRDKWEALQAKDGGTPESLDKEPLRQFLKTQHGFAKLIPEEAGAVWIPDDVINATSLRYVEAVTRLTRTDSLSVAAKKVLGVKALIVA